MKDLELEEMMLYLNQEVSDCPERARKFVARASQFVILDVILMYFGQQPRRLQEGGSSTSEKVMCESHGGVYFGHFGGSKLYSTLSKHWWWRGMYADVMSYCKRCPQFADMSGTGCQQRLSLKPIPVQRPFQKLGEDIMDLPRMECGNKHVVVFQDMFTKWH